MKFTAMSIRRYLALPAALAAALTVTGCQDTNLRTND